MNSALDTLKNIFDRIDAWRMLKDKSDNGFLRELQINPSTLE